jgi:hypothetical protein
MSVSIFCRRAASGFIALGVAAVVLALAVPAGGSTGTKEISPEQAGYTATGAQFREVKVRVFLRDPVQYAGEVSHYSYTVQLWSSDRVAVVGVLASTSGSGYTPFSAVYDRSTHQLIASDPHAEICDQDDNCTSTIGSFAPGRTVTLDIYYNSKGDWLVFSVDDRRANQFFLTSPVYQVGLAESFTQARIGTEFGPDPWTAPSSYTPPASPVRVAAFSDVALTSYSGHTATLWSWWVHHKLLANTGQQTGSDRVAVPTDLTNGGASFQTQFVPQSGQRPAQPVRP